MFKYIRRADLVLFLALIALALSLFVFNTLHAQSGATVEISVDGEPYASYPLSENRDVTIKKGERQNVVRIRDGKVWMEEASCKNQVCVEEGAISQTSQTIVCLPNRVVVRISAQKSDDGIDAVVQ